MQQGLWSTETISVVDTYDVDWRIDERTKHVGRRGIEAARNILQKCQDIELQHQAPAHAAAA